MFAAQTHTCRSLSISFDTITKCLQSCLEISFRNEHSQHETIMNHWTMSKYYHFTNNPSETSRDDDEQHSRRRDPLRRLFMSHTRKNFSGPQYTGTLVANLAHSMANTRFKSAYTIFNANIRLDTNDFTKFLIDTSFDSKTFCSSSRHFVRTMLSGARLQV